MGLFAVIGPSRNDHAGLPRFFSRRRSKILRRRQKSRTASSRTGKLASVDTLLNLNCIIRKARYRLFGSNYYLKGVKLSSLAERAGRPKYFPKSGSDVDVWVQRLSSVEGRQRTKWLIPTSLCSLYLNLVLTEKPNGYLALAASFAIFVVIHPPHHPKGKFIRFALGICPENVVA